MTNNTPASTGTATGTAEDTTVDTPASRLNAQLRESAGRFSPLIAHWLDLTNPDTPTTPDPILLAAMARELHTWLSMRDALIISAMNVTRDHDTLLATATNPHQRDNGRLVAQGLSQAFSTPPDQQARAHTALALQALERMREHTDLAHHAQPHAMTAYLAWWQGDTTTATTHATRALDTDPECTLAGIVHIAISHHIQPASAKRT